VQYRVLSLLGAVGAGIALWRFTSGDWMIGSLCALAVVAAAGVYLAGQRRLKGGGGGGGARRY
jgi:hypothetical protein